MVLKSTRSTPSLRLDGRVALVTGGSRGIGKAIAEAFAGAGAMVMISSRRSTNLEAAADEIGQGVEWIAGNAGDPRFAAEAVAATMGRLGPLDILVNNAATNPYLGPLVGISASQMEKIVQVNQAGVIAWTQAAWLSSMRERGGVVVNIASIGGTSTQKGIGYYNATKAAVIHLTRQLAYELAPHVRVNAVAPGLVKTEMASALWRTHEEEIAFRTPLRRLGRPQDIASAALFLASDAAEWITGATLVVDGGQLVSAGSIG